MEQNLPIIAKKIWKIIQVAYFMLRKGISKGKLLADLSMMLKRGKIASKAAIHNLVFHHHHHAASGRRPHDRSLQDYEFSCSNSPAFNLPFHLNKRKHVQYFHAPPQFIDEDVMAAAAAMEIISAGASPALPGFGPSPLVRQLRVTDSPFPVKDVGDDGRVDEAAEQFIMKFYKGLRKENSMACLGYY